MGRRRNSRLALEAARAGPCPVMPIPTPLDPPARLLCGPGPSDVEPVRPRRDAAADARPPRSRLPRDPRRGRRDAARRLAHAGGRRPRAARHRHVRDGGRAREPARAGRDRDRRRGRLLRRAARRHGRAPGRARRAGHGAARARPCPNAALLDALDAPPRAHLVAVVHAETSTGAQHPLRELGEALAGYDALLMADCVTSLGGVPLDAGRVADSTTRTRCTQKCLGAPPGMAPVAISPHAWERIARRRDAGPVLARPRALRAYWVDRPVTYHHTAPILAVYALHEALRVRARGGAGAALGAARRGGGRRCGRRSRARGLSLLADPELPARAAHRRAGARTASTARRCARACSPGTASRSAAGSGRTRRRSGGSA